MKLSNTTPYIIAEIGINFEGKIKLAKSSFLMQKNQMLVLLNFNFLKQRL